MKLQRNAAPGIHRIEDAHVNWYLVEEGDRVCIVDAGHPASWRSFLRAIDEIEFRPSDVEAVILTHAHFDHVGFAERARRELDIQVWVHDADTRLAAHPWSYRHERSRAPYALAHPSFDLAFARMGLAGALGVRGVDDVRSFADGDVLPVAGSPEVIHLPGHTDGQCAFAYPDRDAIIVGDAIVTHDPYTNGDGPRIVARAATADSGLALASLERLRDRSERTVLVGHGEPWTKGTASAIEHARLVGAT